MHRVVVPDNLKHGVTAFFSGKVPGSDIDEIATFAGVSKTQIYLPVQRHTDKVLILDSSVEPKIADAVVTGRKDILIGVQVADCVPLLLYDKKNECCRSCPCWVARDSIVHPEKDSRCHDKTVHV